MWIVRIILLVLQRKKHRFERGGRDAAGPVRAADEADGPLRQALAQVQALDAGGGEQNIRHKGDAEAVFTSGRSCVEVAASISGA